MSISDDLAYRSSFVYLGEISLIFNNNNKNKASAKLTILEPLPTRVAYKSSMIEMNNGKENNLDSSEYLITEISYKGD